MMSIVSWREIKEEEFLLTRRCDCGHSRIRELRRIDITGYDNAVKAIAQSFAREPSKPNGKLNIIPGFVDPGDMREIKRILTIMGVPHIIFPDTTDVFDAPLHPESGGLYPPGGTTISDLMDAGNSRATIALGRTAGASGAVVLKGKFGIPAVIGPMPIGIRNTDAFVMSVSSLMGIPIPQEIEYERGRLVDMMTDAHPHFHAKSLAIFGDPDTVIGLVGLAVEMGMNPVFALTGTPDKKFAEEVIIWHQIVKHCKGIHSICTRRSRTVRWICSLATPSAS